MRSIWYQSSFLLCTCCIVCGCVAICVCSGAYTLSNPCPFCAWVCVRLLHKNKTHLSRALLNLQCLEQCLAYSSCSINNNRQYLHRAAHVSGSSIYCIYINSFKLRNNLGRRYYYDLLRGEENEAQRGSGTCSRSHSSWGAEPGFEPRLLAAEPSLLTTSSTGCAGNVCGVTEWVNPMWRVGICASPGVWHMRAYLSMYTPWVYTSVPVCTCVHCVCVHVQLYADIFQRGWGGFGPA